MKTLRLRYALRLFPAMMLFSLLSLLAGCATVPSPARTTSSLTDLEAVGRFGELEKAAAQRISTQTPPKTALLGPLCLSYARVKRYDKLFDCVDRLEKQIQAGDTVLETDKPLVAGSDATPMPNMLRAEALIELGNYPGAIKEAKVALEKVQNRLVLGMWSPKRYRLSIMGTLGLAYALSGDRGNAVEEIRKIEDFNTGFLGFPTWALIRRNAIARIYMALGEYGKAFEYVKDENPLFQAAMSFSNAAWGYSGEDRAEIFLMMPKLFIRAICLLELGRLEEAKKTLDAILRNVRIADNGELYWLTLFARGRLAERQKEPIEAIGFYSRAIDVIEQQRSTINSETNKIGFVGDKQAVYGRLIALLAGQGRVAEAFDYVERSKSRALVDMLASRKDFAVPRLAPEKAKQLLTEMETLEMDSRIQDETGEARQDTGRRDLQLVRQKIRREAPDFSSLVAVSSVPLEEIKGLIEDGEALVEYYYQGAELYAFVLDRGQLQMLRLDAAGLDEEVQRFRNAIQHFDTQEWQAPARALYARLWKPLEGVIAEKDVTIVGHGSLHYLPFVSLLEPDGSLLIDHFQLRFLPSASVLKFLRPAIPAKETTLLVLGNPDLGNAALNLQFAESEAKAVASLFPGSRLLIRKEASETNFKKAAGLFQRFHFATHGQFQADSPLESRLYLTKDEDNDGTLTAGELYTMNMDADLVTLSACQTGLGRVASGDDVVGMTRGFLYAGSRSVVASLWSVDDRATSELMQAFYQNLGGMNKDRALAEAQVKVRQTFPHPFFWAAFQVTGRAH